MNTGAVVDVRDDKSLGSEWEPADNTTEASDKPTPRRSQKKSTK